LVERRNFKTADLPCDIDTLLSHGGGVLCLGFILRDVSVFESVEHLRIPVPAYLFRFDTGGIRRRPKIMSPKPN